MSKDRETIQLNSEKNVAKATSWLRQMVETKRLAEGWILSFTRKRSDLQNARMWAILRTIAKARPRHFGQIMDDDDYKVMFVHGLRKEARFIPDMTGEGVIPIPYSSSDLTVSEFNMLFEIIERFCAEKGIDISHHAEPKKDKAA
jgi:hypothetical protein